MCRICTPRPLGKEDHFTNSPEDAGRWEAEQAEYHDYDGQDEP